MNRYEYEEEKHQHKMEEEEYDFWGAVYTEAHELAKLDGIKEIVRIKEYAVYKRVMEIVNYGPVSYGDAKASFIQGFYSSKGTWFSLTRPNH